MHEARMEGREQPQHGLPSRSASKSGWTSWVPGNVVSIPASCRATERSVDRTDDTCKYVYVLLMLYIICSRAAAAVMAQHASSIWRFNRCRLDIDVTMPLYSEHPWPSKTKGLKFNIRIAGEFLDKSFGSKFETKIVTSLDMVSRYRKTHRPQIHRHTQQLLWFLQTCTKSTAQSTRHIEKHVLNKEHSENTRKKTVVMYLSAKTQKCKKTKHTFIAQRCTDTKTRNLH